MIKSNCIVHFEIPVLDIDRAVDFYSKAFETELRKENMDGYEMAFFKYDDTKYGSGGALVKGDVYKPSKEGVFVYFGVDSIENTLKLVQANGGKTLYEKKSIGEQGFVAEFEDLEGNRIALHEDAK